MSLENIAEGQGKAESESRIKRWTKNIGKKLAIASLTTALTLGAAELIFREYEKHSSSVLFIDNKVQTALINLERAKFKPYEIAFESRCNSRGDYDNQEFTIKKSPGIKRVAAISDSFGCVTVPIRYHAFTKAENLEGKLGNPKWEIYNFSRSAINTEEYLFILREEALKYNPDLSLIGFYCGNDLDIDYMLGIHNREESKIRSKEPLSEKIRLIKVAKRLYMLHKAGYLFGEKGKRIIPERKPNLEGVIKVHSEDWWMNINNESPIMPDNLHLCREMNYLYFNKLPKNHQNYSCLREIFAEMKQLTNDKLVVVLFPGGYQVDDDLYNKMVLYNRKKLVNVDRNRVYNSVKNILEEQNIPVIELLEPLKQGYKEHKRVYYLNDIHLNYWGNDIAAGEIRKYIRDYFSQEKEGKSN